MGFSIIGGSSGGGGGASNLQQAYNGGSSILRGANGPVNIQDALTPIGASSPVGFYNQSSNSNVSGLFISDHNLAPNLLGGREVLGETNVTITAPNVIDFGVDLTTLTPPPAVSGVTTNFFSTAIVILKSSDVSGDASIYTISNIQSGSTTNSAVTVTDIYGNPVNLTSTTGIASITNQSFYFQSNDAGGPPYSAIVNTGQGDGNSALFGLYTDSGNFNTMFQVYNIGSLVSSMFSIANFGPTFGFSADVPYITLSDAGVAPDAGDIRFSTRSADPTTTGLSTFGSGQLWWNDTDKVFKYWDGTSIKNFTGISNLQQAYDGGRDINITFGLPVRFLSTVGTDSLFEITDDSGGLQTPRIIMFANGRILSDVNDTPHFQLDGLTVDPSSIADNSMWWNPTDGRLKIRSGGTTEEVAFLKDVPAVVQAIVDGVGSASTYATVKDAVDAGATDIVITGNTNDATDITIAPSTEVKIKIQQGVTWTLFDVDISGAGSSLIIEGDSPSGFYTDYTPVLAYQFTTVGKKLLNDPAGSKLTIRNLRIFDTTSLSDLSGVTTAQQVFVENVRWELGATRLSMFTDGGDSTKRYYLNNVELVGGGGGCKLVMSISTAEVFIDNLRFTGTFDETEELFALGSGHYVNIDTTDISTFFGGTQFNISLIGGYLERFRNLSSVTTSVSANNKTRINGIFGLVDIDWASNSVLDNADIEHLYLNAQLIGSNINLNNQDSSTIIFGPTANGSRVSNLKISLGDLNVTGDNMYVSALMGDGFNPGTSTITVSGNNNMIDAQTQVAITDTGTGNVIRNITY